MKTERHIKMTERNDVPLLLRKRLEDVFEPEKIVGYQYSIGYITEDWDLPIENYYCEKTEVSAKIQNGCVRTWDIFHFVCKSCRDFAV